MQDLIKIENHEGQSVVTSLQIAEDFEKLHKDVLEAIAKISNQINSAENSAQYFILDNYKDSTGRILLMYLLTRDGFSLLVMGFTGAKALQFKLKYINAFNAMENALKNKPLTQAEILASSAQLLVDMERKVNVIENKISNVLDVFTAPFESNWKQDINAMINAIIINNELSHITFRRDIYKELEFRAKCDLAIRQTNHRKRLKQLGATSTECKAISKLDIIDRDVQLKAIFEGIVKKYQAKYALGD